MRTTTNCMKESNLFYELIRVAVGQQVCLSHTPSVDEWGELYAMAKKQSLVGVCFAGVQRLQAQRQEPPEMLYLTWMGMAAKIQQRNEVVNRQCVQLGERLKSEGYSYCVLKGQGVAALYKVSRVSDGFIVSDLSALRQSGDIDVWISGSREKTLAYVQKVSPTNMVTMLHAELSVFPDTDVEVHFIPTYLRCPWKNRRLQAWFEEFEGFEKFPIVNGFRVPTDEFNLVFLALHIFRHLLGEGIGMRQLMDYYFVLKHVQDSDTRDRACDVLNSLGLGKFAGALMWICEKVFGLSKEAMLCAPDSTLGQMILQEIELAGNFGQHDERSKDDESSWHRFWRTNATNLRFLWYFPEEVLCTPFYRVWHKCWQWKHGYVG